MTLLRRFPVKAEANWEFAVVLTRSRRTLNRLTPDERIYIRVAAVGGAG